MTFFFDQVKGIIPAIYRLDKKHKPNQCQILIRKIVSMVKLDGRFVRWLPYWFWKRYPPEGFWEYKKGEYIWRER